MHLAGSNFKYLTALTLVVLIIYLKSFIYDHNLMFTLPFGGFGIQAQNKT